MRHGGAAHEIRTVEVRPKHAGPARFIEIREGTPVEDADDIAKDIDATFRCRCLYKRSARSRIGTIESSDARRSTYLERSILKARRVYVCDCHARAFSSERYRGGAPDARRRACDDDKLVLEPHLRETPARLQEEDIMWKKIIIASWCRAGLLFSMASRGSGERHARPDPGGGLRADGFLVGLSALLTASCAEVARPSVTSSTGSNASIAAAAGPAQNPFLLASYNNQSHWNDAATDSTDLAVR
jgi:hypothetical protein